MDVQQSDIDALLARYPVVDLHPDLVPHIHEGRMGPMIDHRLVMQVGYSTMLNHQINGLYEQKLRQVAEAEAAQDWSRFILLHERPYRLDALEHIIFTEEIDDPEIVWPLIAHVWTDTENVWSCIDQWVDVWNSEGRSNKLTMSEQDQATFDALPDRITVYRGVVYRESIEGMSWSTSYERAAWFAKRFAGRDERQPLVATGVVRKEDVLAYFNNRSETEIVAFAEDVHVENVEWV